MWGEFQAYSASAHTTELIACSHVLAQCFISGWQLVFHIEIQESGLFRSVSQGCINASVAGESNFPIAHESKALRVPLKQEFSEAPV